MLNIAGIITESVVDGEGWRYVLFVQGCKHECPGCHNKQTWGFEKHTQMTAEEVLDNILETFENNILLDGVTISGGDPLYQAKEIAILCKELKKHDINIWVYTGFTFEQVMQSKEMKEVLQYIDVLVDGPFIESEKTLDINYVGSSNQRIIDVPKTLKTGNVTLKSAEQARW